jgi:hypothetical protein
MVHVFALKGDTAWHEQQARRAFHLDRCSVEVLHGVVITNQVLSVSKRLPRICDAGSISDSLSVYDTISTEWGLRLLCRSHQGLMG